MLWELGIVVSFIITFFQESWLIELLFIIQANGRMGHRRLWDITLWFWKWIKLAWLLSVLVVLHLFLGVIWWHFIGLMISHLSSISFYYLTASWFRFWFFIIIYTVFTTYRLLFWCKFWSWMWIRRLLHKSSRLDWALTHLSNKTFVDIRLLTFIWIQKQLVITTSINSLIISSYHWIDHACCVSIFLWVNLLAALILIKLFIHFIYAFNHWAIHYVRAITIQYLR